MSIIGKISLVHKILSKLSKDELIQLEEIINRKLENPIVLSLYNKDYYLKDEHKGVHYVTFYLDPVSKIVVNGILCYIDEENCAVFSIYGNKMEQMSSIQIDPVKNTYIFVDEGLDIEELRRELYDLINTKSSGEINVYSLADLIEGSESVVVDINEEGNALEVHLDADVIGKIENSLQVPKTRPSTQELVGIDTTGGQNRITVGEGLTIENGGMKVSGGTTIYKHVLYNDTDIPLVEITSFDDTPLNASNIRNKRPYFINIVFQEKGVLSLTIYNNKVYLATTSEFLGSDYTTDLVPYNFTLLKDVVTEL